MTRSAVPLIREMRGSVCECTHEGHLCGIDDAGEIRYALGDPDHVVFLRSAGKPVQALPVLMSAAAKKFGLSREEMAVMIGSHRAEHFHVRVLESIMDKLGLNEKSLVCKPAYPLGPAALEAVLRSGGGKRSLYHNCSGKHLGIIAYCLAEGYPIEGYWEPSHPAQLKIAALISLLSGCPLEKLHAGIDGCGLPVFGMPLRNAATIYLSLACPELIEDHEVRQACREAVALMTDYPAMIAGTDRICSELLLDANIVAKGGAKGIYCFALKKERLAFAFKVLDGSEDEWPLVAAAILEQIGYGNAETIARMRRLAPVVIVNDNGLEAGANEIAFTLRHAREARNLLSDGSAFVS